MCIIYSTHKWDFYCVLKDYDEWKSFSEILEVSQIYSVVWKLNKDMPLVINRPFRQVHHTASKISIVWWWSALTPWEISLAHKGILFFDELTEFPRETLEVLRQPLEDKCVNISRVSWSVVYPANIIYSHTSTAL